MKNYKVIATKYFRDSNEIDETTGLKKERQVNDIFYCTKERYDFLKQNNAVKLVEIEEELTEEVVQAVASAIVEEAEEQEKSIEEVVNEIVEETVDEVVEEVFKEKPKKKKSSKK